jgi:gamma-tubulin complex component 2
MIRWKFVHTVLIQLKVTERQLADVWQEQQSKHWQTRVADHPELEGWKMRVFKLRHRMIFFVQNVLAFYTTEIIEPNWAQLEKKMESARTVDQFLKDHTDFLNECRRECMLTDVRFVEVSISAEQKRHKQCEASRPDEHLSSLYFPSSSSAASCPPLAPSTITAPV